MDHFQRTLIVGGKGMLAAALAGALRRQNRPFVALDLPEVDITRPDSVRQAFAAHRPTLVLNCAAYTKVDLCEDQEELAERINAQGVANLAEAAGEHRAKLLHVSTDFIFDGRSDRPYREAEAPNPLSAYGRTKLHGEQKLQQINPPGWLICRTAWLYGRQGFSFPRTMVEKARAGQPLSVVNDQSGSPTYTVDLAAAMLDLVQQDATGIYHTTNSGQTTWHGFAQATLEAFGLPANVAPITTEQYLKLRPKQAIRPRYSVMDTAKLTQKLGGPMRPWQEALAAFHAAVQTDGGF